MSVLSKKIKGSTIIEVIIALLIGMMVLAMAMAIVVKTGKNYNATHRTRALLLMKNRLYQIKDQPELRSDTVSVNGILLFENLSEAEGKKDVLNVYLKAMTPEGRTLLEKRHFVNRIPDYEDFEE